MPRNHSESQLVQIGSKALHNVAGQFTKLGQSLNPAKIRSAKASGRVPATLAHSPSTGSLELASVADEESMAKFTIGSGHLRAPRQDDDDADSDDSMEVHPAGVDVGAQENAFLPSVGIVMASNEEAANAQLASDHDATATASDYAAKRCSADVCTMSISSVMDHINMPAGMLECGSPVRSRSPAPEIRVDDVTGPEAGASGLGKCGAQSFSRSSGEVRSDSSAAGQ